MSHQKNVKDILHFVDCIADRFQDVDLEVTHCKHYYSLKGSR